MTDHQYRAAMEKLKKELAPSRYRHILRTVGLAKHLARKFKVNQKQAMLAAAFHDCGKYDSLQTQRRHIKIWKVSLNAFEKNTPALWHAPLGAVLARRHGVRDQAVLNAIRRHTTADSNMTKLDMITYLADALEPGRRFPGISHIRRLASRSLRQAFREALRLKMIHVLQQGNPLHPKALAAWNSMSGRQNL